LDSSPVENFLEHNVKPVTKEIGRRIGLKFISEIPFIGKTLVNPRTISFLASLIFKNPAIIAAAGDEDLNKKILDYFV